jgi:hypothetical protein
MMAYAAYVADLEQVGEKAIGGGFGVLNRALPALFCLRDLLETEPAEPLIGDVWLEDVQVMTARSVEGSRQGFYLAAKGGHNGESHNHNDVGNFIVFYNGGPVLIDAGAQTYTAQTFSSRRYELWNNQSAFHNLPTINGIMQSPGPQFEARQVEHTANPAEAGLSLELVAAYPGDTRVKSWKRRILLNRGKNVTVSEAFELEAFESPSILNLLTPLEPLSREPGLVVLRDPSSERAFDIRFRGDEFEVAVEPIEISDDRMANSWGNRLFRIQLISTSKRLSGNWQVVITAR